MEERVVICLSRLRVGGCVRVGERGPAACGWFGSGLSG